MAGSSDHPKDPTPKLPAKSSLLGRFWDSLKGDKEFLAEVENDESVEFDDVSVKASKEETLKRACEGGLEDLTEEDKKKLLAHAADPKVHALMRETALKTLFDNAADLIPEELKRSIGLGLADPDSKINEVTWGFIRTHHLVSDYHQELKALSHKLKKEGDPYSLKLAGEIQRAVE